MADRLERDASRREQDGAFVASLLDSCEIAVGQVWWIHGKLGEEDDAYPVGDPRRNWLKGNIVEMGEGQFGVSLEGEWRRSRRSSIASTCSVSTIASLTRASVMSRSSQHGSIKSSQVQAIETNYYFTLASRTSSCDEILEKAHASLRCIEWEQITKHLMTGAICGAGDQSMQANELFQLSRPIRQGAKSWGELERARTS